MGLEQKINLLEEDQKCNNDDYHLREQIRQVWSELGFLEPSSTNRTYTITDRGRLLFDSNSITRDRALYWLQDRYISAWLPTSVFRKQQTSKNDIFFEIAKNPELVALYQRVLNSYADQDWHNIASVLPTELFQSSTIVDLGGGIGSLLRELSKYCFNQRLICIDRPEVIRLTSPHPHIEFLSKDMFSGSLPSADFYLLSRVLHDWPDEKVKIILNRIPAKYLCVIEREVDLKINQHALLSLHMFLVNGAKERTRQEWNNLFSATAWSVQSRTSFSGHIVTLLKKDSNISHTPTSLFTSRKTSVRKVVLPIAGLGTRMRPQSTILPKVLLPIVQSDSNTWKCRPVLDLLLEEIFTKETEIEQVLCVIAPEQLHIFQSYLSSYPRQNIDFILQQLPKGFGHAVLQTEQYIDNEPFVVMLSDHLYQSNNNNQSCLQQLLNAYRQNISNSSVIGLTGVMTCTAEEVLETGLLQADIDMKDKQFFEITDMIEKPSIEVALKRFQSRIFDKRFLCQAGIDILPPTIFDQLRYHEQKLEQENVSSELGLREAMNSLRQNGHLRGCLLDGHRYDIGNPKEYYRTFRAFTIEKKQKLQQHSPVSNAWPLVQHIDKVRTLFSISKTPIYSASAPGRLDVMGGLIKKNFILYNDIFIYFLGFADYSGSHVLQYPIAQSTHAFVQISNINTVRMISIQTDNIQFDSIDQNKLIIWEREIPMNLLLDHSHTLRKRLETWYNQQQDILLSHDEPVNWPSYILGILVKLMDKIDKTSIPIGFNVVIISDVPCNKGVASSAALEVAVARAGNSKMSIRTRNNYIFF
jgi:UTP--glucose-1-phosphate uridylyltransferase